MNDTNMQAVWSALRSVLIALGSYLATKGVLNDEQVQQIVGAAMIVLPLAWGVWQKYQAERSAAAREVVAVNVGILKADSHTGSNTPLVSKDAAPVVIAGLSDVAKTNQPS